MTFTPIQSLPEPNQEAKMRSLALQKHIAQVIHDNHGWISFSRYMDMVLYDPQFGYYTAGDPAFGAGGDFTTAPEMTSLFTETLAQQFAELLPHCSHTIYEFGAGSGILARDLLRALKQLGVVPKAYYIIELSASLAKKQYETLRKTHGDLMDQIHWIDRLPDTIEGVLFGNEVLDAMPCELIHWQNGMPLQRGVTTLMGQLKWLDRPIGEADLAKQAAKINPGNDYISEINQRHSAFIASLADRLTRGALLFIDYGFSHQEYYHPQRCQGTLMGHYRQHAVTDPFFWPGLMDLTAHVDFTAIAQAGVEQGLTLIGYTTQAHFLINAGMLNTLANQHDTSSSDYFRTTSAIHPLLSQAEMGELFKVIGFSRDIPTQWIGFSNHDMSHRL